VRSTAQMIVKYWEIIADKLSSAGWSWGYRSAITQDVGSLMHTAGDVVAIIVESDELLSAFVELETSLL
jgi:hypothetical protein